MNISCKNLIYNMDKNNSPACKVKAPCTLSFETLDCFEGQVKTAKDTIESIDFNHVNPCTGPVYIEDAQIGDALALEIKNIEIASTGILITAFNAGSLPHKAKGKVVICEIEKDYFIFEGQKLPLSPMIGVIGVAPAGEPVNCGTPGAHGGNMDTTGIKMGSTLYLPVFTVGALLALGDLHAAMGDGEVGLSGLEVAGNVDLQVTVLKNRNLPWPLLFSDNSLSFIASAKTLDEAIIYSADAMHDFILKHTNLDTDSALMLMSACGDARISQIVDPLLSARFCMPVDILEKYGFKNI